VSAGDGPPLSPAEGAAILAQLARGPNGNPGWATALPQQLAIAEARYRALVEQIPAVTFMASLAGGLSDVYVSPQIEGLLGFSQEEWMSDPVLWFRQLHPEDRELWNGEFARGCATGGPFRAECRFLTKDDQVVWVHGEARLIPDEFGQPVLLQGVAFDITESKRAEEIVKHSLREKELLLKEIHHRVKNNLQITSSLLRLQAGKIADASVRQLLRESQDRIRSMALVHDMLYRSQDLARVDFPEYVRTLVVQLFRSYNASGRIRNVVELEGIVFGVDLAVPCGLIINELVANALKHAFPGDRQGVGSVRGVEAENLAHPGGDREGQRRGVVDARAHADRADRRPVSPRSERGGRVRGRISSAAGIPMSAPRRNILVVEDENIVAMDLRASLLGLGYDVTDTVGTGSEAIGSAQRRPPDLVLMDINLRGEMDGITAADVLRTRMALPVVYLTAFSDDSTLRRARVTEPFGYLLKPFDERELHIAIEMAIYRHQAQREHEKLLQEQAARAAIEKQHRWTRFLAEASEQLSATLDVKSTLDSLVRLAVPQLADWAMVHFKEGDQIRTPVIHHAHGKEQLLHDLLRRYPPPVSRSCSAKSAIRCSRMRPSTRRT